ncbi:MAG: PEP-CTERM sorting domain-containing protein [Phycisphaerales bacterium]
MYVRAIACSVCAMGVASAQGAISFTFADPSTPLEVTHTAGAAPDGVSGLLTYDAAVPMDFIVYSDEAGYAGGTFADATLSLSVVVGPAFGVGGLTGANLGEVSIEFFDSGGNLLLSGQADGGTLSIVGGLSGAWTVNSTDVGGGLDWTASGALLADLQSAGYDELVPSHDASFTLTNVSPPAGLDPTSDYLPDFTANSAFTGTSNVPAPGALALAGLVGIGASRRRRK